MSKIKTTLTVGYASGETIEVARAKGEAWDDVVVLLKQLFTQFFTCKGYLGELFHHKNEAVWGNLRRLCAILPIAGPPGSFLDFEQLDQEDWELLCTLFFTSTANLDEETGCVLPEEEGKTYSSSKIAKLHGIDFFEHILMPALEENKEIFMAKQRDLQEKTAAMVQEQTTTEPEKQPIPLKTQRKQRTA